MPRTLGGERDGKGGPHRFLVYTGPTRLMPIILGFIFVAATLCLLLITLQSRVLPAILEEEKLTLPAAAWLDLWLPLILTAPMVIALTATRATGEAARFEVWYAATPATIGAALALGVFLMMGGRRGGVNQPGGLRQTTAFALRHATILSLLGTILALASKGDQFTFLHGGLFLVAGIFWMWMSSPEVEQAKPKKVARDERAASSSRRPQLILDWAGALKSEILLSTKVCILATITGFWLAARFLLPAHLPGVVMTAALFQLLTLGGIGFTLGRAAAIRTVLSTLVLSVLFGLGSMAFTRMGGGVLFQFDATAPPGALALYGMSALRATGLLLLGMGVIAFVVVPTDPRTDAERFATPRSVSTGLILVLGALILGFTANQALLNQARNRVYDVVLYILHPVENAEEESEALPGDDGGDVELDP